MHFSLDQERQATPLPVHSHVIMDFTFSLIPVMHGFPLAIQDTDGWQVAPLPMPNASYVLMLVRQAMYTINHRLVIMSVLWGISL